MHVEAVGRELGELVWRVARCEARAQQRRRIQTPACRRRREPSAVAPRHLVHHQRLGQLARRVGRLVGEELRSILRRRPCTEGLGDGVEIVVDRLWQRDDAELVPVLCEVRGELGGGHGRLKATDRVEHLDAVLLDLLGCHLHGLVALLNHPAVHRQTRLVDGRFEIDDNQGILDSARLDEGQQVATGDPLGVFGRDGDSLAHQQALIPVDIPDYLRVRVEARVIGDEVRDALRLCHAWRREHGDLLEGGRRGQGRRSGSLRRRVGLHVVGGLRCRVREPQRPHDLRQQRLRGRLLRRILLVFGILGDRLLTPGRGGLVLLLLGRCGFLAHLLLLRTARRWLHECH
mmetsp:Transcript_60624/g.120012  ORF Transcript_60624/g.120012 Transcript_60624/m.120012 type:complete len:346 (+) Transcript_60624:768-1805(+)